MEEFNEKGEFWNVEIKVSNFENNKEKNSRCLEKYDWRGSDELHDYEHMNRLFMSF